MKNYLFVLLIFLCACNESSTKVTTEFPKSIDLISGLNTPKDIDLSFFVDDVSLLELEGTVESYTRSPKLMFFGKLFLLVHDENQRQVFLFERNGKFVRKVGNLGNGPGEYSGEILGTMNSEESRILICDKYSGRVTIYDTFGEPLFERNITKEIGTGNVKGLLWNKDSVFEIIPHRPFDKNISYNKVVQFDSEINLHNKILPSITNSVYNPYTDYNAKVIAYNNHSYFWESICDTIFQFDENNNFIPAFIYASGKSSIDTKNPSILSQAAKITSVNFIPNYFITWVMDKNTNGFPIFYNLDTKEIFSIKQDAQCGELAPGLNTYSIKNDIFGFEPVDFRHYNSNQKLCYSKIPWNMSFFTEKSNCLSTLNVKNTIIRDKIVNYFENPDSNLGLVLILFSMKDAR